MTYGVHPHAASEYDDKLEKEIEEAMSHPRTVAWVRQTKPSLRGDRSIDGYCSLS